MEVTIMIRFIITSLLFLLLVLFVSACDSAEVVDDIQYNYEVITLNEEVVLSVEMDHNIGVAIEDGIAGKNNKYPLDIRGRADYLTDTVDLVAHVSKTASGEVLGSGSIHWFDIERFYKAECIVGPIHHQSGRTFYSVATSVSPPVRGYNYLVYSLTIDGEMTPGLLLTNKPPDDSYCPWLAGYSVWAPTRGHMQVKVR